MRARCLVASVALLSTAVVVACATDDSTPYAPPEAPPNVIPSPDSGADDADADVDADATAPPYVCAQDELCPNDLFGSTRPGGGLDPRTRIQVIRGRSASDVWVAGVQGAIAHFDGTSWTRSEAGTKETVNALWLRESDEIALASISSFFTRGLEPADAGADAGSPSAGGWRAVGAPRPLSTIRADNRLLESAWAPPSAEWAWLATVEAPLGVIGGVPSGLWRVRVAPADGVIEIASPFPAGTCGVIPCSKLTSIHGASADVLWAVGYTGATVRISGAQSATPTLTAFDSKTWAGLDGVWAASETEAWSVGGGGVIRHYTGHPSAWDVVSGVPTTEDLHAVWGTGATDVWAVGNGAVVLHYDGQTWSQVKVGGLGEKRPNLYTVWSPAPGHVWIGGEGVLISIGGK
jgi:hypothetical protein